VFGHLEAVVWQLVSNANGRYVLLLLVVCVMLRWWWEARREDRIGVRH
jgi:hypothetical protein